MVLHSKNISVLLATCLLASVAALAVQRRHEFAGSLASDCQFMLCDREYNLCPIFRQQVTDLAYGRPNQLSGSLTMYKFNLGGSAGKNEPQDCNRDTWICMINQRRDSPSTTVPLSGSIHHTKGQPYATIELEENNASGSLVMTFDRQPQRPTSQIKFLCDPHIMASGPSFVEESDGIHLFTWTTVHACGRDPAVVHHTVAPENDRLESHEDEKQDQEDDGLLDPVPISDRHQRSITTIVLLTGFTIVTLAYVFLYPPACLLRLFQAGIDPSRLRSRIGECRLIHWAGDDMAILEDEEDVMVNAEELEYGATEEIPLKPSPKRSHFLAKYGST